MVQNLFDRKRQMKQKGGVRSITGTAGHELLLGAGYELSIFSFVL
jgi:hypothetical protein